MQSSKEYCHEINNGKPATESKLISDILHALWPYAWLTRVNTAAVKMASGGTFRTGTPKGYPDISGHRKSDGKAVYIECKLAYNKPSPEQLEFIAEAKADGAIAGVCRSVDEALTLIGKGQE